jgi:hypothetical protein
MEFDAQHGPLVELRATLLALGLCSPAAADCHMALLLALDVSSSIDADEYVLQRDGVAAALEAPEVAKSILGHGGRSIALAAYEWSGQNQSVTILDWTMLKDKTAIKAAADHLRLTTRSYQTFPTAIGPALGHGAVLLQSAPDCRRRVIDISGDGVGNDGFEPRHAYRHFPFDGVTVNGLAVLGADPKVAEYYYTEIRYGFGAFVETAQGYEGYQDAMRRKLMREINGLLIGSR